MSIDVYSYPVNLQSIDQKSHRTSLQKAGFASMMDVLHQNELMNQQDNDSFVLPEESVAPVVMIEEPIVQEVPSREKPIEEEIEVEQAIEQAVVAIENIEEEIILSPIIVIPMEAEQILHTEDQTIKPIIDLVFDEPVEIIEVENTIAVTPKSTPVVMSSPIPVPLEMNTVVEVATVVAIPDVLDVILPELLLTPKKREEAIIDVENPDMFKNIDAPPLEIANVLPKKKSIWESKESKEKENSHFSSPEKLVDSTQTQSTQHVEMEEDPKIRFVRYVEEEIKKPTFQSPTKEQAPLPENMLPLQDSSTSVQSVPVQATVAGVERGAGQVVSKTDVMQANTILEKSAAKEEPVQHKQKIQQSFAKLLKQAQEAADELEESFHTEVLKKLELHVKDPSGVIQLEIAQKEAVIHIRAVAPIDAMRDLHYLGQDIQGTLQDLGLQLGSYELKSQDEEGSVDGFDGSMERADDIDFEEQESHIVMSNYIVDKRI